MIFKKDAQGGNSISTKIILMAEAILFITGILFCIVAVYTTRADIRRAISQRMLDIVNCAAGSVDGDVLGSITRDKVGSAEYNELYNKLAVFRDNVELEYIYSLKEEGDGQFIFTMDLDQYTPAAYGDSVEYTDALAMAGKGTAAVDEIPYTDKWGQFYSAYSPVFDSKGDVAGIVAVDFSAAWFDEQLSSQTRKTIANFTVILLISFLVAAVLLRMTLRPFVKMQGQLLEEKVAAESANRAKSDFLANMSHEIRTPINTMLGMNEMILREGRRAVDPADKDRPSENESLQNIVAYAGDVENAGHNLLAIINDILDFSKIEEGRMDLVEAPYRISTLVGELRRMLQLKANDKKLDFSIDMDDDLPDGLCGDQVRVRQVFTNVLNNAIKYTENGSVRMALSGKKQDDGTLMLCATVKDTGIGIRQEDIGRLYDKFERLEMERNSTVEGTGLGLVITKRLLDMMGGSISVDSTYGEGSEFTVTLPQKVVSAQPVGNFTERFERSVREAAMHHESFTAPDARILIVDDTALNLSVAKGLLKDTGMKIDTASGGAEALSMTLETRYDLILMDQRMPNMDGITTLHNLMRQDGKNRGTKVICLTADAISGAKERYVAEGFTDYLTKPIDSRKLDSMLKHYLPPEKVKVAAPSKSRQTEDAKAEDDKFFDRLSAIGIDTSACEKYFQGSRGFYLSVIGDFVREAPSKKQEIASLYDEDDMKEYCVRVHALKSSSRMIGAAALSDMAAALEKASGEGDKDTISGKHSPMMSEYERITEALSQIEEIASKDNGETRHDDDEILEFLPQGQD